MEDYLVMRCGSYGVTIVSFNDRGVFTDAASFPINHSGKDDAKWLSAFSKTLDKIPKNLRENVSLVIPPNNSIFTKYITLPDVETSKYDEALRFEFIRNFPGDPADWVWESYKFEKKDQGTFIFAMQSGFAEQLLDTLLRKRVTFSYLCPEILLMQLAIQKFLQKKENIITAHVGAGTTLLSVSNRNAQYVRIIPFATDWVDEQIANSQKISLEDARTIRQEQVQKLNDESNGASFVRYYVRQFGQKFQQELKRSELFFYRTISQSKTYKILLSGPLSGVQDFSEIIQEFNPDSSVEPASQSVQPELFSKSLSDDKCACILQNAFTFVGASQALVKNHAAILNLFSETFRHQITFQRRNPSYMAVMIIVVFATILGLKLRKQRITFLESQKLAVEAKLRETIVDAQKYNETVLTEKRIRESIRQIKGSLYSQDDWLNLFNHIQSAIKELKYSWIESFNWRDSKHEANNIAHVLVKIFTRNNATQTEYANDIQKFITTIKNYDLIKSIDNISISEIKDSVLSFSFDMELDSNSEIFLR